MKKSASLSAVFFSVCFTSGLVYSDTPVQSSVQQDGLLVNLDQLGTTDNGNQAEPDGGILIPLSYEMFEVTPKPVKSEQQAEVMFTEVTTGVQQPVNDDVTVIPVKPVTRKLIIPSVPAQKAEPAPLVTEPDRQTSQTEPGTVQLTMPVKLVEAAASETPIGEEADDATFEAIVEAMTPEEPAQPLRNKRFTFYLSDAVAFAQIERSTDKFKLKNGRIHLATIYSEERDSVVHGGIALDASFTKSFRLSFGLRSYIALLGMENTDAFATAVGAEAAYRLPFKAVPLEFSTSLYYAPDILTFGAGDRAIDAQADVTLPFRTQAEVFAGLRFLQVDIRPEDQEIDNRVHLGFRWNF